VYTFPRHRPLSLLGRSIKNGTPDGHNGLYSTTGGRPHWAPVLVCANTPVARAPRRRRREFLGDAQDPPGRREKERKRGVRKLRIGNGQQCRVSKDDTRACHVRHAVGHCFSQEPRVHAGNTLLAALFSVRLPLCILRDCPVSPRLLCPRPSPYRRFRPAFAYTSLPVGNVLPQADGREGKNIFRFSLHHREKGWGKLWHLKKEKKSFFWDVA